MTARQDDEYGHPAEHTGCRSHERMLTPRLMGSSPSTPDAVEAFSHTDCVAFA